MASNALVAEDSGTSQRRYAWPVPLSWDEVQGPPRPDPNDRLAKIRFYMAQCDIRVQLKNGQSTLPLKQWRTAKMHERIRQSLEHAGLGPVQRENVMQTIHTHMSRRLRMYEEWINVGRDNDAFYARFGGSMTSFLQNKQKMTCRP
jgi:hypothetical protein